MEGYQKVIDGARAVVDNYRPHIVVDPEWPLVDMGEICQIHKWKEGLQRKTREYWRRSIVRGITSVLTFVDIKTGKSPQTHYCRAY